MKKIFTFVSALVLALSMQAAAVETIQVDGIYYQLNDDQTAVVLPAQAPATKYEQDSIVIPVSVSKDDVTYTVVELAKAAFRNSTAKSIKFAEGSQVTTLGMQAFQAAVELTELELPEGIKLIPMTCIHNATATNPMKIKKLVLPSTLDSLALFSICLPQLETIVFKGTVPPSIATKETATWTQNPWMINVDNACNTNKEAVVIVPFGKKEAYQYTPWIGDYFTTIQEDIVEVANIAAFNALEDGKAVKLMLTDAKVTAYNNLFSVYYVEDATAATVMKCHEGVEMTVGTALNGYLIGTKSIESVDYVNYPPVYVEHLLTIADERGVTATETTLEPTVMTIPEACTQDNYAKLITIENVTVSGGNTKTLTDANENTIKSRDLLGVLSDEYEWPTKVSSITGILLYYMTGWFIVPISEETIVINTEGLESVENNKKETVKFILNGHLYIQHRDRIYDVLGR